MYGILVCMVGTRKFRPVASAEMRYGYSFKVSRSSLTLGNLITDSGVSGFGAIGLRSCAFRGG